MGTLLKAKCECGFENNKISFGAAMEEVGKCFVPALRNGSATIEIKDIRNHSNHKNFIFYTDELFYDIYCDEVITAWEFKLMKKKNLCPKCKNYKMEFIHVGHYD